MKRFASLSEDMFDLQGMKCACFVNLHTQTDIASNPWDCGSSLIKSVDMEDQGLFGISRGRSKP
jgi:hypothetical protein